MSLRRSQNGQGSNAIVWICWEYLERALVNALIENHCGEEEVRRQETRTESARLADAAFSSCERADS